MKRLLCVKVKAVVVPCNYQKGSYYKTVMNIRLPVRFCIKCGSNLKMKRIEGKKRLCCPECGWIYYENPLSSVAAVVKKDDSVLLIKRGVEPEVGKWALPLPLDFLPINPILCTYANKEV